MKTTAFVLCIQNLLIYYKTFYFRVDLCSNNSYLKCNDTFDIYKKHLSVWTVFLRECNLTTNLYLMNSEAELCKRSLKHSSIVKMTSGFLCAISMNTHPKWKIWYYITLTTKVEKHIIAVWTKYIFLEYYVVHVELPVPLCDSFQCPTPASNHHLHPPPLADLLYPKLHLCIHPKVN